VYAIQSVLTPLHLLRVSRITLAATPSVNSSRSGDTRERYMFRSRTEVTVAGLTDDAAIFHFYREVLSMENSIA